MVDLLHCGDRAWDPLASLNRKFRESPLGTGPGILKALTCPGTGRRCRHKASMATNCCPSARKRPSR